MKRRRDGERIVRLRAARGLTQEGLAELTGLDRNTISRIETGSRGLTINTYYLIADALGVEIWQLFRDE